MNKNLNELLELKNYVNYLIEMVLTENPYNLNAMGMKHVQNYYKPSHASSTVVKKPTIDNTTKIAQGKVDDILARKRIDSMKPIPQKDWPSDGKYDQKNSMASTTSSADDLKNPYTTKLNQASNEMLKRYGRNFDSITAVHKYEEKLKPKINNWNAKYYNDKVYKDTLEKIGDHDRFVKNGPPKPMSKEKQEQVKNAINNAFGKK